MRLTKTNFIQYLESPLHLWAHASGKETTREFTEHDQLVARQGYEVESLAKQFLERKLRAEYPAGSTISFEDVLIDGDYEARADAIIHDTQNDTFDIYEIKSKTKVEKQQKYDATFQYLVSKTKFGAKLNNIFVVHANGDYVKQGEFNLAEYFVVADVLEECQKLEDEVYEKRHDARNILRLSTPPLDEHCFKPKDCPCKDLCHPDLPEFPIYDLPGARQKLYEKLIDMGIEEISQVPDTIKINPRQRMAVQAARQETPITDREKIKEDLNQLQYPLYFLDYETVGPPVPKFDGYTPYQHIVFQYSLHVVESADAIKEDGSVEAKHYEFISTSSEDPSYALCESLLSHIGSEGSVISWHKSFEIGRNKDLAKLHSQFADQLLSINERMYDLKDPFAKSCYVDKRFHGSASIKDVLPVLVPELNHKDLSINNGALALTRWYEMVFDGGEAMSDSEMEQTTRDLLEYCKLDTWAMVEVWRVLKKLAS